MNPLPQGLDTLHGSVHRFSIQARFRGHSTLLVQVFGPRDNVLGIVGVIVVGISTENSVGEEEMTELDSISWLGSLGVK